MVETHLNMFDVVVFAVLGLSALLSFFRGFVRELLSLGAWAVAAVITLYSFPSVATWIQPHVKSTMVASGFASMGTFMITLLLLSIFTTMLMKMMKSGSDIGLMDNGLGLIFGLVRGALLVSVGFFVMSLVMKEEEYPDFVKTALSRPYAEKGAKLLAQMAPSYLDDFSPLKEPVEEKENPLVDDGSLPEQPEGKDSPSEPEKNSGYRWDSMEHLQQLIDKSADAPATSAPPKE